MNFEYVGENGLVLRSAEPSLFLKAHVKGYTRGDGVFVAEHDDSRPDAKLYDHPNVVGRVSNHQVIGDNGRGTKAGNGDPMHHATTSFDFGGSTYHPIGKTGASNHDGTEVQAFEDKDGHRVWADKSGRVHADGSSEVKKLRQKYEASQGSGAQQKPAVSSSDREDNIRNTVDDAMHSAKKNLGKGTHQQSASLALRDARNLYDQGKMKYAHKRAVDSLKYSVGILHSEYQKHYASQSVHNESEQKPAGGAKANSGHAVPAGLVSHADSAASDSWYKDTTKKLSDAGYQWHGFDAHGGKFSHPKHGTLHVQHGLANPDKKDDGGFYSRVVHSDQPKPSGGADHSEVLGLTPETPDQTTDHALAAGAKSRSNVAVFSSKDAAHRYADRAMNSKGSAFVMKHDGHPHHVVVSGADAQRMARNGYKHVK